MEDLSARESEATEARSDPSDDAESSLREVAQSFERLDIAGSDSLYIGSHFWVALSDEVRYGSILTRSQLIHALTLR